MKKYLILILLLLLPSCEKNNLKLVDVQYKPEAELQLIKKLVFKGTDSIFTGNVRDMVVIKNKIYVSDRTNSRISVFDQDLHYIKSSNVGKGPGEFTSAPYLHKNYDTLIIYQPGINCLEYLDSNFITTKIIYPPPNFITDMSSQPVFRKNKILISAFNKDFINKENIGDVTTALLFNYEGKEINNFCLFDDIYNSNAKSAYYRRMRGSLVAGGFQNSYFVIQLASNDFNRFDSSGNYIETLHYKPHFYKDPPKYNFGQLSSFTNEERYENFITKTTFFKSFFYDKVNNLLYLNYNSSKMEQLYTRSLASTKNYLIVINSSNECIYDNKIEGFVADVEGGYIYTVVKETPLTIYIYLLKK